MNCYSHSSTDFQTRRETFRVFFALRADVILGGIKKRGCRSPMCPLPDRFSPIAQSGSMPLVTDARRNILGLLRHFVGKQRIKTMDASIVMLQNGNRMMSLFSSCARMGRSCLSPGLCPITDRSARRFAPTARRGRQDDGFVGGLEYSLWICRRREKNPNFFGLHGEVLMATTTYPWRAPSTAA
jgi:hypothetical protein